MLPGIKLLISYCRFIGNTFFGWTYHGERIAKWKIIFYKLWNITIIILLAVQFSYAFEITMGFNKDLKLENIPANNTNNKIDLFNLLFLTSNLTFNLQGLLTAIYLLIFGGKIMTLLIKQDTIRIEPKWEHNLVKWIILVQVICSLMANVLHIITILVYNKNFIYLTLSLPIYISTSNQIFILSIIIYKSMIIRRQLVIIFHSRIDVIYNFVLGVDKSITDLDRYLSLPLFFLLLANQIFCIANICQVALGSHIFDSLCVFVYGAFNLIILCYMCNIIPSTLSNLLNIYEQECKNNKMIIQDRIMMMQLRQLNDRIGFTVFGLFRITGNTLFTCLGLIISYSVIIIQTGNQ